MKPPKVANLDEIATFAEGLPITFLICRINNRHIADPRHTTVRPPTRHERTYIMEGPCLICGQPVRRAFDEEFGRVRTRVAVAYDSTYLRPKGSGRIDAEGRRILVGELMRRSTGKKKRRGPSSSNVTPMFADETGA